VERQGYLGIYLSKDRATVVGTGSNREVGACFSVSLPERGESDQPAGMSDLVNLIAEGCAERQLYFSEAAVALDCAMFMQHEFHSEFTDARQIGQTVKFDAEEALSTDIAEVAVAFKVNSSGESGSELTVFTVQRRLLSEIILALQGANIDPITVEPDANCLSRFIGQKMSRSEDGYCLFAMLSRRRAYFLAFDKAEESPPLRTFLVDHRSDRSGVLSREIPVTLALTETDQPTSVMLFDSTASTDRGRLGERLGLAVGQVDVAGAVVADSDILAGCDDQVEFAVAYGAALSLFEKTPTLNFRSDFMPHQGKKARLQGAIKFLSVSVGILVLALGTYVTSQLLRTNKDIDRLREAFAPQYADAMLKHKPPREIKMAVKRLNKVRNIIVKGPIPQGDDSVASKLVLVLEAFNKNDCAKRTKLDIDKVTVTGRSIRINGSTARQKHLDLFQCIRSRLDILGQRISPDGGRQSFFVEVAMKTDK
jgi:hypothetical protein